MRVADVHRNVETRRQCYHQHLYTSAEPKHPVSRDNFAPARSQTRSAVETRSPCDDERCADLHHHVGRIPRSLFNYYTSRSFIAFQTQAIYIK